MTACASPPSPRCSAGTSRPSSSSRSAGRNAATRARGLHGLARPNATPAGVGQLVVTAAHALVRLNRERERDAARRGRLGLVGDAVVPAAARVVLVVAGP